MIEGHNLPEFHFQPIADLRRASVAGYEALVRLPVRAKLAPDVCLAAAARFGIQQELEAVITSLAWQARRSLPANVFMCMNVSPLFLCSPAWRQQIVAETNLSGVVVELTEAELITDYALVRKCVAEVCERGGMVAIDDAGAGYASLKHILELRPNFIKLDRSFVQNCAADRAKSTMIEVLGAAANRMDAWVITEGVETAAELGELLRLDVPLAQGYFLGRPRRTMEDLTADSRRMLHHSFSLQARAEDLLLHAEVCPGFPSRDEAQAALTDEVCLAAVTDVWGRPVELIERHSLYGVRVLSGAMRCHAGSAVREALQRALTRPTETRFDPILITDDEGRLCGVVRLERLMQAVLDGVSLPAERLS